MMKERNIGVLLLFILLFATTPLLSLVSLKESNEELDPNSNIQVNAVTINGNGQLSAAASAGIGTKETPYILEGYVDEEISISNTNAYFILRNCTFSNPTISGDPDIFVFNNVTNGIFVNNTFTLFITVFKSK